MSRRLRSYLVLLLTLLTGSTGCHPTQPFYFHEDGDFSHYLDMATDLEHPEVYEPSLAEVQFAESPLTLSDPEAHEMWDLSLEDVVSIAMNNSQIIRNLGGVTPFGFSDALVGRTAGAATIYDTAIIEADPNNGVEAALAAFDAQLNIVGSNNGNLLTQTDRPSTFQQDQIINRNQGGLRSELSKRTATGLQMFFRNQTDYTRGDNLLGQAQPVNSVWETLFEVEARYPLLRGKGTQINRIPVVLARINTDVSLANFEASVRNLVLDIENTYWDLHCAYRGLETAKAGRDAAQLTWHQTYESFKGGIETKQAEAQSREQYYFFRSSLETALRDLQDVENRLRFLMGLTPTDRRLIRPVDEPTTARVDFDWLQIHQESLIRSTELRQQKWVIKRRELELIAAKNQLLPQFDMGLAYRWYGAGDHLVNADRNGIDFVPTAGNRTPNDPRGPVNSTAFDVLTNGFYQEGAVFFSFQMPVGFRRELAGVQAARLSLVREQKRLADMELNASHLLTNAVRGLDFNYRNAQTHVNRLRAASEEVASVQALYDLDKITLDLVLDAQRRRAQAQIDYYRALCEYNKSVAVVHFRKGSLLEYNSIFLAEGPWPDKAYWDALGQARQRDASYYMNYGWSRPSVISQGSVPQQVGDAPLHFDEGGLHVGDSPLSSPDIDLSPDNGELVPAPEPQPAEPPSAEPPSEDAEPSNRGPFTNRPEGPTLNAPRRAQLLKQGGQVAGRVTPADSFQWGSLGGLRISDVKDASNDDSGNPLRQASHEE